MDTCVVLDFDGVLCDSARETAATAWRAGAAIWPEWAGPVPPGHVERFCEVRPWLETGYQAILMMRMVDLGCGDAAFSDELAVWEARIMAACGLGKQELVALFGGARDQWMHEDRAGWLAANRFFEGTVGRVKAWLASGRELYVATTKQERFVEELLGSQGVVLPEGRLYGLDCGISKEELLVRLSAGRPAVGSIHFVEDRLETLRRVEALPELDGVALYLARWGYCTPADREAAEADRRITGWSLEDFLWKRD